MLLLRPSLLLQTPPSRRLLPFLAAAASSAFSSTTCLSATGSKMAATPQNMAEVAQIVKDLPAIVCYHHPCTDGVFAALAAQNRLGASAQPPRFAPLTVFKDPQISDLDLRGDEVVYLLDYSGPAGFAQRLAGHCAR
jgi:hypothetical protein